MVIFFWFRIPDLCTTRVYKTGKFIGDDLCKICLLIFISFKRLGAIRPGEPIPKSAEAWPILQEIHCPE